jgi:hypothetical protein
LLGLSLREPWSAISEIINSWANGDLTFWENYLVFILNWEESVQKRPRSNFGARTDVRPKTARRANSKKHWYIKWTRGIVRGGARMKELASGGVEIGAILILMAVHDSAMGSARFTQEIIHYYHECNGACGRRWVIFMGAAYIRRWARPEHASATI